MTELSHWKRAFNERVQQTERAVEELRIEGRDAAGHLSAAMENLLADGRRRRDEAARTLSSELRRPLSVARAFATEYISAALRLDAFAKTSPTLEESVRSAVERQLEARAVATRHDLQALERRVKSPAPRSQLPTTAAARDATARQPDPATPKRRSKGKTLPPREGPRERSTVPAPPL